MRHIIIPTVVASLIAAFVGHTTAKQSVPTTTVVSQRAPERSSDAKAIAAARSVWSDLTQVEVDGITVALKAKKSFGKTTVFCERETACGDLALSIENAFESAKREIDNVTTPMVLPGFTASSQEVADLINGNTGDRYDVKVSPDVASQSGGQNIISIGRKPK